MKLVFVVPLLLLFAACSNDAADKQRYFESGNRFFDEKKYQEAVVEYRNAIRIDGSFGAARAKLADSYVALGEARGALQEYVRAADLMPDDTEVQLKAATMLSLGGQFDDARTRVRRVLEKEPTNVQAHLLLGRVLAGLRDLDGAVAQIEEAIQVDPNRGTSYSSLGSLRFAQGDREAARAAFEKAVEIDPKSLEARLALVSFHVQAGDLTAAEESLASALALEPNHALANRTMAALYLASNRAADAEKYVKAYVQATPDKRAQFALADYYASVNRPEDARAVLQPLTSDESTGADAEVRLAVLEYRSDRVGAHSRIDGVLARKAEHVDARLTKARWLLAERKPQDALVHADRAVKAMPNSIAAHYTLGLIRGQLQDTPAAIASFNEVLRLNPRAASAQVQLSRLQLAQGAVKETVQLAESALKNAPGNPEARLTLAAGLIAQRDFTRAEPIVGELLKQYPNVAAVEALSGRHQLARRNMPQARAAYERALKLDPRSFAAVAGLTAVDLLEKKVDAARQRVDAHLASAPGDPRVLLLASRVYLAANDAAAAERSLRRLVEVAPADTRAYAMLGSLYLSQQRLPEARAEFDQLAVKNPKSVPVRTLAAMLSHSTNELEDAKKRYRDILDLDASAAVAANNLAWILTEEGKDLDEAQRLAERAAAAAPNRAEIHDTLGWIYIRKELPILAIPKFEQSISQDPDNAEYRYHLALAHSKSGNADRAREALAIALKLDPNHREARALEATLKN